MGRRNKNTKNISVWGINTMAKEHILQVNIDNNGGNGAFALMQSFYELLKTEYVFDYFTMDSFVNNKVLRSIVDDGGKCESANLRKNKLFGHMLLPFRFYKFLVKNNYNTIHIHSEVAYKHFLYCVAAKKANVKKIIIHSHSSSIDGNCKGLKYVFHKIFREYINRNGDFFIACSEPAAKWMFDETIMNGDNYCLLNNGIIPEKFKYDEKKRSEVRNTLGLEGYYVIGHVGAFKWVKNQSLLIEILSLLKNKNYKLLLVGDGEDRQKIEEKARNLGVIDSVKFTGNRSDVNELLLAMDIFVFPSFFEGIPISVIEAQCVGLPIIASDVINRDVRINENLFFFSLERSSREWADKIESSISNHLKEEGFNNIFKSIYNINESARQLREIYEREK